MEMEADDSAKSNFISQTEKLLEGIHSWTWCEFLEALEQCQDFQLIDRIMAHLTERLASTCSSSPYTCSSNSSSFQFLYDASSIASWRNSRSQSTWWFEDLLFLNIELLVLLIKRMVSQNFDHSKISKFLFYYHHHRLSYNGATRAEKLEITEVVLNMLLFLCRRSIYVKDLFDFYRVGLSLNMSYRNKNKIECLIGSLLDQTTIDYLLIPSPQGTNDAFDVDLVLRLIKAFIHEGNFLSGSSSLNRLKKVADLLDSYSLEVAPDPHLKASKFVALITTLPDFARESHDRLYLAINLYLKVHAGLEEKEKMSICGALKHDKLSGEELKRLAQNSMFPSEARARALVTKENKVQSLKQEGDRLKTLVDTMLCKGLKKNTVGVVEDHVLPAADTRMWNSCAEASKLKADLHMHCSAMLKMNNAFGEMQSQKTIQNMTKSRSLGSSKSRFLPKLCSW